MLLWKEPSFSAREVRSRSPQVTLGSFSAPLGSPVGSPLQVTSEPNAQSLANAVQSSATMRWQGGQSRGKSMPCSAMLCHACRVPPSPGRQGLRREVFRTVAFLVSLTADSLWAG